MLFATASQSLRHPGRAPGRVKAAGAARAGGSTGTEAHPQGQRGDGPAGRADSLQLAREWDRGFINRCRSQPGAWGASRRGGCSGTVQGVEGFGGGLQSRL